MNKYLLNIKVFFAVALLFPTLLCEAQQDPQFSNYMFTDLYFNPATAGKNKDWNEIRLAHRSQWVGYNATFDDGGAPNTQLLSISMPLSKYNLGMGLTLVNDKFSSAFSSGSVGSSSNFQLLLSIAYHLNLGEGKLSFGGRGGIYNLSVNTSNLRFTDPDGPIASEILGRGKISELSSDFGLGAFYEHAKYYFGVSINHLSQSDFQYGSGLSVASLSNHFYFTSGYNWGISRTLLLKPSVLVKTDMERTSIELSVIAEKNEKFYGGVSFRELDDLIFLFGVNFLEDNRLSVGYALDYVLQGEARTAKSTSSHEIVITYKMPSLKFYEPSPIRNPRYRIN